MMSECQRFLCPGLVNGGDTILESCSWARLLVSVVRTVLAEVTQTIDSLTISMRSGCEHIRLLK